MKIRKKASGFPGTCRKKSSNHWQIKIEWCCSSPSSLLPLLSPLRLYTTNFRHNRTRSLHTRPPLFLLHSFTRSTSY